MSARKTIIELAQKKQLPLIYVSEATGYQHLHHFKRALDNASAISAKRVVNLANVLDEKPSYILEVLTR